MNAVYRGHRTHVVSDFAGRPGDPAVGVVLDTGEAIGYGDPELDVDPSDDTWFGAHDPAWRSLGGTRARCWKCGQLRNTYPRRP